VRRTAGGADKLVLHALLQVFVGLTVEKYTARCGGADRKESRSEQVYRTFRALVAERFREEKRPQAYAAALNVSLSYLNEMVRGVSGFPVGHWSGRWWGNPPRGSVNFSADNPRIPAFRLIVFPRPLCCFAAALILSHDRC
jgi:hypothetical protein